MTAITACSCGRGSRSGIVETKEKVDCLMHSGLPYERAHFSIRRTNMHFRFVLAGVEYRPGKGGWKTNEREWTLTDCSRLWSIGQDSSLHPLFR